MMQHREPAGPLGRRPTARSQRAAKIPENRGNKRRAQAGGGVSQWPSSPRSTARCLGRATFREDMPMRLKVGKDIDLGKQFGHEGHVIGSPDRSPGP
jgi:hypothetical protein